MTLLTPSERMLGSLHWTDLPAKCLNIRCSTYTHCLTLREANQESCPASATLNAPAQCWLAALFSRSWRMMLNPLADQTKGLLLRPELSETDAAGPQGLLSPGKPPRALPPLYSTMGVPRRPCGRSENEPIKAVKQAREANQKRTVLTTRSLYRNIVHVWLGLDTKYVRRLLACIGLARAASCA